MPFFWQKPHDPLPERKPSAMCPACQSPDHLPVRPIVNADPTGEWQVGGLRECFNCRHRFAVLKGRVIRPQWMLDDDRKREKSEEQAASVEELRRKFRDEGGRRVERETDLKWPD